MRSADNPYTPGAGTPPPELAGREKTLEQARRAIERTKKEKAARSLLMLGLRGVGKTVLLNRIEEIADRCGSETAIFEADPAEYRNRTTFDADPANPGLWFGPCIRSIAPMPA